MRQAYKTLHEIEGQEMVAQALHSAHTCGVFVTFCKSGTGRADFDTLLVL